MNLENIKKEAIDVGLISLYFFFCFAIFMILKKLIHFEYKISFYGWSAALVGALAIGKVIFLFNKSSISKKIKHARPINEILLKALVYTFLVFAVIILEKSIHYWLEDQVLLSWSTTLFGAGRGALLLAHSIYIYFCFLGFYFSHFLIELFGKEKLIKILTERR
jgi:hypothetical protein